MSVLPQLERELSAAHARRRRPRIGLRRARPSNGRGWAPVALAAAVTIAVVVIAAGTLQSGPRFERPAGPAAATVYRGRLEAAYAGGRSLYGWPSAASGLFRLVRIDPSAGRVVARVSLAAPAMPVPGGGYFQPVAIPQHMLLAAGSLWISSANSQKAWLWRVDPRSLTVRSRTLLPGGGANQSGSLAVAGGWLWVVNANTLVRVSLQTGRPAGSRVFSHAVDGLGNSIAAGASGQTLVATVPNNPTSAGRRGVRGLPGSRVYRLDPGTGAPVAASATFHGYTPELAGVLDGGAWVNGLTAADGPVRVDLRTLKVTAAVGRFPRVAQVFDGIVEVDGDGASRCVDPVSGRVLAMLPAVVAADESTAFVLRAIRGGGSEIGREALDPRCLTRR